jgi:hypothetical protein
MADKKKSLLLRAKAAKSKTIEKVSDEQIELALAWARGEVSYTQVNFAIYGKHKNSGSTYPFIANGLRKYIQDKNL